MALLSKEMPVKEKATVAQKSRRVGRNLPDTSDPAFRAEYRRQAAVVSEHYRQNNFADCIEPEEEDLKGWV